MGSVYSSPASSSSSSSALTSTDGRKRILTSSTPSLNDEDVDGVNDVLAPAWKWRKNNISIQQRFSYDVFVSFRGDDTRKNFTSHLTGALRRHCFDIFEDTKLPRGRRVDSELSNAIWESRISVVIFSTNYANSRWCLDELVDILNCGELNQQIILPIFLDVEPSDVRRQKGSYEKAFEEHKTNFNQDKIQKWRRALRQAGNLSGLHLQNDANGDEEKLIEQTVKQIGKLLNRPDLHVADHPVGIDSRVQELTSLLSLDCHDVRIIAVWGTGGIGKTTIAKATYCRIASEFGTHCFLADVRSVFGGFNGKVNLQNQFISALIQNDNSHIGVDNYHRGIVKIKQMISRQKVLLVADDVDNVEQLKILSINSQSFHHGSRIIVTTRNKDCLSLLQVSATYQPRPLEKNESLELFCRHAFGKDHPDESYEKLSEEVVCCTDNLPLVIEVWGAHFRYFRTVELWRSTLNKLIKIPHSDVQAKLQISYDYLGDREKKLFLDVACFLDEMDKHLVVKVSQDESLGSFPDTEIETLVARCLVYINQNKVSMHDVIKKMGQEIVRRECEDEPGERNRLWYHTHVLDVLRDHTGTKAVESISLNSSEQKEMAIVHVEALEKMSNPRLIHLDNVHLSGTSSNGDMCCLSLRKLKYLKWRGFPLKYINLDVRNVVAIDLQYSNLEIFWEGIKNLKKLKFLNVSHSSFLTKTPDFSGLKNLEEMYFRNCTNLEELHNSVGCLDKLVVLDLYNCSRLRKLPLESMHKLQSLQKLDLSGLDIGSHEDIKYLMSSLKHCSITHLMLPNCNIQKLPNAVTSLMSLKHLDLRQNGFSCLPDSLHNLHHLETIDLSNCVGLLSVPDLPRNVSSFTATDCTSLVNLPSNLSKVNSLTKFVLDGCSKLGDEDPLCFMKFIGARNLEHLSLMNCNVSIVPTEIESLVLLNTLNLSGNTIPSLPDSLSNLLNLKSLLINNCGRLKSIPNLPPKLSLLKTIQCGSLDMMPFTPTKEVDFSCCSDLVCSKYAYEFKKKMLQLYKGLLINNCIPNKFLTIIHVCLSGTEVPYWCNYISEGRFISFEAPTNTDRKICGFIFSAVIPQCDGSNSCELIAKVVNKTNGKHNYFGRCLSSRTATLCLIFCLLHDYEFVVEGGDNVEVEFELTFTHKSSGEVKKCGLCLIYENDYEMDPVLSNQQAIEYTLSGF